MYTVKLIDGSALAVDADGWDGGEILHFYHVCEPGNINSKEIVISIPKDSVLWFAWMDNKERRFRVVEG